MIRHRFLIVAAAMSVFGTSLVAQTLPKSTTLPAAPQGSFVSVTAGSGHFCGLDTVGDIYCWGDGQWGQLGNGSTTSSGFSPVRVESQRHFRQVAAGATHTCALTDDGSAYCWGSDFSGVMGTASSRERCGIAACAKRPVTVAEGMHFDSLSAGFEHTCGLARGRAYCWGRGDAGQLGELSVSQTCSEVLCDRQPRLVTDSLRFTSISARGTHTCGIAQREVFCWGDNRSGQLGVANIVSSAAPVRVAASGYITQVSAGGFYTCAVTGDGRVECWGANDDGRLGASDAAATRATVVAPDHDRFVRVSVGGMHTCAVTVDGAAYCWGSGADARLGGTTNERCGAIECSSVPVRVALDERLTDVASGGASTCATARNGLIYCWGAGVRTTVATVGRGTP